MATGTIGGETVNILRGIPQKLTARVDKWEVPGLDGYGAQTSGSGKGEIEFTSITYCASNSAANTHINNCLNKVGTVVTVVDNFGDSHPNMLVEAVNVAQAKKLMIWTDSGGTTHTSAVRVELHWKLCTSS